MSDYRNQWVYAGVMSCLVMTALLFFFIFFVKINILKLPIFWLFYGGITAFISAVLSWPRRTKRTTRRMMLTGALATFLSLACLSYPFSLQFLQAFPTGETMTIFDMIEASSVLLLVFPIVTLGAPYWLGIFVAICFRSPDV